MPESWFLYQTFRRFSTKTPITALVKHHSVIYVDLRSIMKLVAISKIIKMLMKMTFKLIKYVWLAFKHLIMGWLAPLKKQPMKPNYNSWLIVTNG